jgi:hypothetical protein
MMMSESSPGGMMPAIFSVPQHALASNWRKAAHYFSAHKIIILDVFEKLFVVTLFTRFAVFTSYDLFLRPD